MYEILSCSLPFCSSGSEILHYNIKCRSEKECVINQYTFPGISEIVDFYSENRLGKVFLEMPVRVIDITWGRSREGSRGSGPTLLLISETLPPPSGTIKHAWKGQTLPRTVISPHTQQHLLASIEDNLSIVPIYSAALGNMRGRVCACGVGMWRT